METEKNYLEELENKVKENLPVEQIEKVWKENEQLLSVAGGAFLVVTGLKFVSKTFGFLMMTGGALLLYKGLVGFPAIKQVLDRVATKVETENKDKAPKVLAGVDL